MSPQPAAAPAPQTSPRVPALASIHTVRRPAGPPVDSTGSGARARAGVQASATERFDLHQLNRGSAALRALAGAGAVAPGASGASSGPAGVPGGRRGLMVDRSAWAAWLDGELLDLTYLEFEVLDFLVRHPGRVYSRAALLRHVWGHHVEDDPGQAGRTVDVLVTRLRRKLGPEHRIRIETVRRVGYRYRPVAADLLG
ncbi:MULTISPECIES: winged helix-turn-helix domain-containing protein [unclassified Pseudofrankia]|uniref:winged helix-turn-helix domain-containing protein n=1 Tax=unclassified Pseudofrankia TaxID=2994372 RepID=UPI0008D990A5|nr:MULTISPECIES: winged helix-turn-helix domain-containing protein [unclassified Pseudofrankia]MDT3445004.1 winged helix-turn-helix domain-containing protein [Pseudofrankia sp. BMG5.37]OHV68250.1 transcriptional regulator [Pseudofrankia sp. BMG5.36]